MASLCLACHLGCHLGLRACACRSRVGAHRAEIKPEATPVRDLPAGGACAEFMQGGAEGHLDAHTEHHAEIGAVFTDQDFDTACTFAQFRPHGYACQAS